MLVKTLTLQQVSPALVPAKQNIFLWLSSQAVSGSVSLCGYRQVGGAGLYHRVYSTRGFQVLSPWCSSGITKQQVCTTLHFPWQRHLPLQNWDGKTLVLSSSCCMVSMELKLLAAFTSPLQRSSVTTCPSVLSGCCITSVQVASRLLLGKGRGKYKE